MPRLAGSFLQKARRHSARLLRLLVGARFQHCFTPLSGCFSPFPHGTGSLSVTGECSALEGGPPLLPTGFHVPGGTRVPPTEAARVRVRGSHPVPPAFPGRSASAPLSDSAHGLRPVDRRSRNPHAATPSSYELAWVWAGPVSLAATPGISVDFSSSGYLDVSVPPVASSRLLVRARVARHGPGWVSPFGNPRIEGRLRLPGRYRSLPRPSSTSCAKASAVRL